MNDAYFKEKAACCMTEDKIERNLFDEFGVKRGLRDFNGKGVLTGLKIESSKVMDGKSVPCDGKLWFRGYEINDLVNGIGDRGFEEVAYLLLMGELPDREELDAFCKELNELRRLPPGRHHESAGPGYHELHDEKRADAGLLRRQGFR